jgi:hypothetical protein
VRQVVVSQVYAMQLTGVGVMHPPVPLQCDSGVNVDPEHDCVPHDTVVAPSAQAPAPLHAPVFPQGGLAAHRLAVSGVPAGMFAQLPALPATLQDLQSAHDMVLQQTPSTQ